MDKDAAGTGEEAINRYALFIEECQGMEKIHDCQTNANEEIYMKAYNMIEKYFSDEEEVEENAVPAGTGQAFGFGTNNQQFNFANTNGGDSMDM